MISCSISTQWNTNWQKKKWIFYVLTNMNESQNHYFEWMNPDKREYICCHPICIKFRTFKLSIWQKIGKWLTRDRVGRLRREGLHRGDWYVRHFERVGSFIGICICQNLSNHTPYIYEIYMSIMPEKRCLKESQDTNIF